MSEHSGALADAHYSLEDRYRRERGRVFLSGSQALVRLPIMQRQRDLLAGLNTAGFISGYTGSPLGGYDIALKQALEILAESHVRFQPGINEDLAATAVWGSQQAQLTPNPLYDGVFGIWYGKGPGVDRSGDALKHGNYSGSSRHGGVIVLAGDDHGAKSSTTAHQSDHAFIHFGMPYFNPATVQDYLDYGLHGFALSRFSGCWVGMKCVTDTIESSASVDVDPERVRIRLPEDSAAPGARNARWGIPALQAEERHYQQRLAAVRAYVRENDLNKVILQARKRRIAIISGGKAFLDLMQALEELRLDLAQLEDLGVSIMKVAMPWPLEDETLRAFVAGNQEVIVVEEKRPIIEDQLAKLLINDANRPLVLGKFDEVGQPLVPSEGELTPSLVAAALARRLAVFAHDAVLAEHLKLAPVAAHAGAGLPAALTRMPSFCAGCPHNSSTKVPEGSMAFGGIGCHGMATFLPERRTPTLFQMGGEGASWIGIAPFSGTEHIFQNLGDGTYYHSGLLAIRAAVAAGVNITYKILVNDAIAMTGGQEIEGKMRVDVLTHQLSAEGVKAIAVVSDQPQQYGAAANFAPGVTIHHRRVLDAVQKQMRAERGVTAIVYDQNCATELRRRRKRGLAAEPEERTFINARVCEGCGDCSKQSNCIAIEPVETPYGRKRAINQSACNKDFACLEGYCPSFVTIRGGTPRRLGGKADEVHALAASLPEAEIASLKAPVSVLVTGIGGGGVVTLGAVLGMAAHLEGKGCSVLDVTGLAQRNGPVTSHVRIAARPEDLHATRIGVADVVIGCDLVVSASADVLKRIEKGRTRAVVNNDVAPTSQFATNPDLDLTPRSMEKAFERRAAAADFLGATHLAYRLMGNEVAANAMLVGYALQRGWLPVSRQAVERALELNGTAVAMNKASLAWGRLLAGAPHLVERALSASAPGEAPPETLDQVIERNAAELSRYQDSKYADRYRLLVARVRAVERDFGAEDHAFSCAVARYYFKLLAYKDEYEVARLYSDGAFERMLRAEFDGDISISYNMAPPILFGRNRETKRYPKRKFGPWLRFLLQILAVGRRLRGTPLDVFGLSKHRKEERALILQYEAVILRLLEEFSREKLALIVEIASLPEMVRGFDVVKDESIVAMRAEQRRLFDQLEGPLWRDAAAAAGTVQPKAEEYSR